MVLYKFTSISSMVLYFELWTVLPLQYKREMGFLRLECWCGGTCTCSEVGVAYSILLVMKLRFQLLCIQERPDCLLVSFSSLTCSYSTGGPYYVR